MANLCKVHSYKNNLPHSEHHQNDGHEQMAQHLEAKCNQWLSVSPSFPCRDTKRQTWQRVKPRSQDRGLSLLQVCYSPPSSQKVSGVQAKSLPGPVSGLPPGQYAAEGFLWEFCVIPIFSVLNLEMRSKLVSSSILRTHNAVQAAAGTSHLNIYNPYLRQRLYNECKEAEKLWKRHLPNPEILLF